MKLTFPKIGVSSSLLSLSLSCPPLPTTPQLHHTTPTPTPPLPAQHRHPVHPSGCSSLAMARCENRLLTRKRRRRKRKRPGVLSRAFCRRSSGERRGQRLWGCMLVVGPHTRWEMVRVGWGMGAAFVKGGGRLGSDNVQANPAIANAALLVNTHLNPSTSLLLSLFSATVIL